MSISVKQLMSDAMKIAGFSEAETNAALGSWTILRETIKDLATDIASVIYISHTVHGNPLTEETSVMAIRNCKDALRPLHSRSRGDTPDPPDTIAPLAKNWDKDYTSPDTQSTPPEIVQQAHRYATKLKRKRKATVATCTPKVNIF